MANDQRSWSDANEYTANKTKGFGDDGKVAHTEESHAATATAHTAPAQTSKKRPASMVGLVPNEAIAGAVSGGMTRMIVAPLDLIKIRFQVGYYKSLVNAVRAIFREEGVVTFWRGNTPAMLLWMSYSSLSFATYQQAAGMWINDSSALSTSKAKLPPLAALGCGGIAGGIATTLTYPLDLLRTRLASQGLPRLHKSTWSMARQMIYTKGSLAPLYQGLGSALIQVVPYSGMNFMVYKELMFLWNQKFGEDVSLDTSMWSPSLVCGSMAGMASKLVTYPLDTVKKRMQIHGMSTKTAAGIAMKGAANIDATVSRAGTTTTTKLVKHQEFLNSWRCFSFILRNEGTKGLFRGVVPSMIKAVPSTACSFTFYEMALGFFNASEPQ